MAKFKGFKKQYEEEHYPDKATFYDMLSGPSFLVQGYYHKDSWIWLIIVSPRKERRSYVGEMKELRFILDEHWCLPLEEQINVNKWVKTELPGVMENCIKEWEIAEKVIEMAKKMKATEIISLEGVATDTPDAESKVFYFGDKEIEKCGAEPIKESIVMGVSDSLMMRYKNTNCLFATAHSQLPDSKAAAKIIELLDKFLY